MKYEVDLPAEVMDFLSTKAEKTGRDVVYLIEAAVVRFVEDDVQPPPQLGWSDDVQARRSLLIDRDIAGTITDAERLELKALDRLANGHFDEIASPPMDGVTRLHKQLLNAPRDQRD